MALTLLPALDVADGQAVRLTGGQGGANTSPDWLDPRDLALAWQADGAEWIHLADLDAAFGRGSNAELLAAVVDVVDLNVQLSGGIGDDASLHRALATGCQRVVIGTGALVDTSWCSRAIAEHGDRIVVALDVRVVGRPDGSRELVLAPRGGGAVDRNMREVLEELDQAGCARFVVTEASRDGMLSGPDLDLYRAVVRTTSTPVIASGGIATLADLAALVDVEEAGRRLEGVIVGKALGAGRFSLAEALQVVAG